MKNGNESRMLGRRKHLDTHYVAFVFLVICAVIMLFPFVWMILSAFKTKADVYDYPPRWIPSQWNWNNFRRVFEMIPLGRYYINSIYTSVVQTALQIGVSILGAYSLVHLRWPGQRFMAAFMRSSMFVPMVVVMIPMYLLIGSLGLLNTYAGIILPQISTAFTTFLLMSYFASIPRDMIDAANLDGCGPIRVMTQVVLPNTKGAIATATLFSFLGNWKSYTWPLLAATKTEYRTLPIGLKLLMTESSKEYQVMMAASLMTLLPVLILFVFFEKQLVRSITLTGMKS